MKGYIAILLLAIILLESVCANPRVKSNSKSQALRKDKKKKSHDQKVQLRENVDTSIYEESVPEDDHADKIFATDTVESEADEKATLKDNYIEPLAVGDTFTAGELLPVTQKLFEKLDNPGRGKGIVSSARSPQELADKIFQSFFMTSRRIVTLTDFDITGLDALQSLALVGDPVTSEKFVKRTNEKKDKMVINGQIVEVDNQAGKRSRYNMLHKKSVKRASKHHAPKKVHVKRKGKGKAFKKNARLGKKQHMVEHRKNVQNGIRHARRRGHRNSELLKRLGKNRHLVVHRKSMQNKTSPSKNSCRWSYECKDPTDLDTCRLKAKCAPRKSNVKVDHAEYINVKMLENIDPKVIAHFRKSLSINALDEEVEKIIESRVLKIKPENMGSQEIEGLSEYFQKLMNLQEGGPQSGTTPMPGRDYDSDNIRVPDTQEDSMEKLNAASLNVAKLNPRETSGEDKAAEKEQKAKVAREGAPHAVERNSKRAKKNAG